MPLECFDKVVEARILAAQKAGEFDALPGHGLPLVLDDDPNVPDDLRLAFKILKNADCLPPELDLRSDIVRLRDRLSSVEDGERRAALIREVNMKILRLNLMRRDPLTPEVAEFVVDKIPTP